VDWVGLGEKTKHCRSVEEGDPIGKRESQKDRGKEAGTSKKKGEKGSRGGVKHNEKKGTKQKKKKKGVPWKRAKRDSVKKKESNGMEEKR